MQHKNNIQRIAIITFLMLISWCVVLLIFADYHRAGFYFWGGFGFGLLSFVVAEVSILALKTIDNRNTTEINYIPVYCTGVYLAGSMIINIYFIMRKSGKYNALLVAANLILFIVLIAVRLFTYDHLTRVDYQTGYSADKLAPVAYIQTKLSVLIGISTDSDIKKRILELKELVDYSSNVTQNMSQETQNLFILQLEQVQTMINENTEKKEIIKKIEEATVTWRVRNSMTAAN